MGSAAYRPCDLEHVRAPSRLSIFIPPPPPPVSDPSEPTYEISIARVGRLVMGAGCHVTWSSSCLWLHISLFANGQTSHLPHNAFEGLSPGACCHVSCAALESCPCPQPGTIVDKRRRPLAVPLCPGIGLLSRGVCVSHQGAHTIAVLAGERELALPRSPSITLLSVRLKGTSWRGQLLLCSGPFPSR